MAAPDHHLTETVQPEGDQKWVFLQDDGDVVKEQLLEEEDGYAKVEKPSLPPELSANDLEKFVRWCRAGKHDMSGLMENIRGAALRLETAYDTENYFWW
ncbi:hypothetical protein MTO96_040336 [Rhipicephalus appendiculatus]